MKRLLIALTLICGLLGPAKSVWSATAPEGAATVVTPSINVKVLPHAIEIHNLTTQPLKFSIYSITGQMIKEVAVNASETLTVDLPSGCYIVRSDAGTRKVVVR